jgi:hypothetical protein
MRTMSVARPLVKPVKTGPTHLMSSIAGCLQKNLWDCFWLPGSPPPRACH